MKNKSSIITLIVVLSILAIGVIGLLVMLLTNNIRFHGLFSNINFSTSKTIIHDEYYENRYNLIDINNSLGDIYLFNSEDERIHVVVYGEEDMLSIEDNESLNIKYKGKSCFGFCFNNQAAKIEIYIPTDYDKKIQVENSAGNIKVNDFPSAILDIDSDLGDTKIGNIKELNIVSDAGDIDVNSVNRIKVENNLGDIKIDKVTEYLDIEDDCGDIKIKNIDIKESSRITNNMGDIKIGQTNDIRIESKVSLGEEKVNDSNSKSDIVLDIKNSCGDIEVN